MGETASDHFFLILFLTVCSCTVSGSESENCDSPSGQCSCLPNVVGLTCDCCAPQYYGLGLGSQAVSGCLPCNCHPTGSADLQCDDSGQCPCLPGVTGAACDQCLQGYFNFTSNGCQGQSLLGTGSWYEPYCSG